ncbi:MAG: type II toxin-antitoxin system VapC family toxin [Phycisphaerae bacterium]
MFLLDTCALSELVSKHANPHAVEMITSIPDDEWFLAAASVGEIRRGIDESAEGARRDFLEGWFREHVVGLYLPKIIAFGVEEAKEWGTLLATLRRKRHPVSLPDSLIAATALVHGLTVVTRNVKDFAPSGVKVSNPWR